MTTKDRIKEFLTHLDIGQNAFEKNVGISNGYINNNKGSFGSKIIDRIGTAYPELNINWLLTGKGEMLNNTTAMQPQSGEMIPVPPEIWEVIKNQAASLKAKDEQMNRVIAMLEREIEKRGDNAGDLSRAASKAVGE